MNTNNKLNKANSYRLSQELLRNKALKKGVTLVAPETTFLSKDTLFGKNVTVDPYVVIGPGVKIGDNSHIKSFSHLEGTKIEKNVTVGPYARLREGTVLKKNTKIGLLATDATIKVGIYSQYLNKKFNLISPPKNLQIRNVNKSIKLVKMGRTKEAEKAIKPAVNYLIKKRCKKIILGCTELPIAIFAYKSFKKAKLSKTFMDPNLILAEASMKKYK